jgi:hypothetical protein
MFIFILFLICNFSLGFDLDLGFEFTKASLDMSNKRSSRQGFILDKGNIG